MVQVTMRLAVALALTLASGAVHAQTASQPVPQGQPGGTPAASAHAPTPLLAALARGAEAYHRHDYDTAMAAFREAATLDAQAPTPRLCVAAVQSARGDHAAALATLREALRLASAAGDDTVRARVLAGVAMADEAQGHWDDALLSWQDDARFADAHAAVAYPASAHARVDAIQRRNTLAQQYGAVRQRIADRLRANAAGQGASGDAAAAGSSTPVPVTPPRP